MIFPPDSPPSFNTGCVNLWPVGTWQPRIKHTFNCHQGSVLGSSLNFLGIFEDYMQMFKGDTPSVLFSSRCSGSRRRCRHNTLILIPRSLARSRSTSLCPLNIHMKPHSAKSPQIMVHFLPTISSQGPEKHKFCPPLVQHWRGGDTQARDLC